MITMKYNRAGSVIFSVPWSHATPSSGIASVSVRTVDIQEDLIHFYLNTDKATPQFGFVDVNNNGEMTEIKP